MGLGPVDLIVGFIFTWMVGLLPAIIARYVLVKRPLRASSAYWIAGISCFIFAVIGVILRDLAGEPRPIASGAWILVFLAQVFIMKRGHRRSEANAAGTISAPLPTSSGVGTSNHAAADSDHYATAGKELISGNTDPALWARALVAAEGDDSRAKAAYVRLRFAQLENAAQLRRKQSEVLAREQAAQEAWRLQEAKVLYGRREFDFDRALNPAFSLAILIGVVVVVIFVVVGLGSG